MGNICGINVFDMLVEKYGDEFAKIVAIEKSKELIDGKVTQLKSATTKQTGKIKENAFKEIDDQSGVLDKKFQEVKKSIDSQAPGGVQSIEKLKGQPIQKILGYDSMQNQFKDMKKTAGQKFDEEEGTVLKKIDENKASQFQNLDKQRPSIPVYDQLPEEEKKQLIKKGQKQFAPIIKRKQEEQMGKMGDKFNPNSYLGDFKNIVPAGSAQGKVKEATEKFQTLKKTLTGGGIPGFGSLF